MHERQAVIFGVLLAGLALVGLGALAVYTGSLSVPGLARGFSTAPPDPSTVKIVPCPPAGAAPVPYAQITVNVYNGSSRVGVAASTAADLASRSFIIGPTGNKPAFAGTAQLKFGVAGVAAAYTVAAQFANADMVLDSRADASVDVTVGQAYAGALVAADLILLDPAVPFAAPAGCIPIDQITLVPVPAPTTDATDAPAGDATPAA